GYVLNDPEDEPLQPLQAYYQPVAWWQHSAILRLAARAGWKWRLRKFGGGDYTRSLYGDPHKWNSVVEAFRSIRPVARERGAPVLVVIFPMNLFKDWKNYPYRDLHEKIAATAKANGFEVIDLLSVYESRRPVEIRLDFSDAHPNALGHRLAAGAIAEK